MQKRQAHQLGRTCYSLATVALGLSLWVGLAAIGYGQSTKTGTDTKAAAQTAAKVNVNTADAKTLETLPGIGPTIAQRIIEGRPYHSITDLEKVKGLSPTKVEALKGKVTFAESKPKRKKSSEPAANAQTSETPSSIARPARTTPSAGSSAIQPVPAASSTPGHTASSSSEKASSKLAPGERININTASAEELDRLPGIGPAKAKAIVDYRTQNGEFKAPEDIQKVKGIKAGEFNKLKDYIKVTD
jgi:competence protein ComEA